MISKPNTETVDATIRDLHATREQLSDKFGGDIGAILDDARRRQAHSGRRIIARGELANRALNPSREG
jgi:hypothetical protein